MKDIINILFRKKPLKLILSLYEYNCKSIKVNMLKLTKESDLTYSHSTKLFKILEENKIITMEKIGRERIIKLTNKGKILCCKLLKINDLLSQ